MSTRKPTRDELRDAIGKTLPDVIAPELDIVFCGINPGLYTAAVGHHFARPGNRFWPALYAAGLTPRLMLPEEEQELLQLGYGITNVVPRATAAAAELTRDELIDGGRQLVTKILRYQPRVLAVLGIGAFRSAFGDAHAKLGRQETRVGNTELWVLPNPSGLNAHFQINDLAQWFRQLRDDLPAKET